MGAAPDMFSQHGVDVQPLCLQLCLMRALALDEGRLARAARKLDLALLDAVTWPEFVWDHLKRVGDDLHHYRYDVAPAWTDGWQVQQACLPQRLPLACLQHHV